MKYLLDTAPWINGVTLPDTLPARVRRVVEDSDIVGLCSVSLLEAAILHRLGRLELEGSLKEFFAAGLSQDVRVLELTPRIADRTNQLPDGFPGDPFDRAIVATAADLDLTLITTDPAIRNVRACAVEYYPFRRRQAGKR